MGKAKTLVEDHRQLLKNESYCDVKFMVGDLDLKEDVRAHKLILASRSPVFTAMFYGGLKETGEEIKILDSTAEIFRTFLEYLYTDATNIDKENFRALIYLATKYDVQGLVDACESYCLSIITLDEVCTLMNLATNYNLNELWTACIQFIVMNTMHMFPSNYLDEMDVGTLHKFALCDELAVEEILIFKCLRSWAEEECSRQELEYHIENERKVLGDSLQKIRFPTIKNAIFTNEIATINILTLEEEVDVHRSLNSDNKISSKYFPQCPRLNIKETFGWSGYLFNKSERLLMNQIHRITIKSLILRMTSSNTFYIGFTSMRSTHFGSSDISDIYEIDCPAEYIDKYILVFLPQNGYDVVRQTVLKVSNSFVTKSYTKQKGKLEISQVLEDVKNDDQLKAIFNLKEDPIKEPSGNGYIKACLLKSGILTDNDLKYYIN